MAHLTLLFGILPNSNYDKIVCDSKGGIQYAADALQKSIIEGLGQLTDSIDLINLPFVGSFPKRYNKSVIPSYNFTHTVGENDIPGYNVAFSNITGYKLFSRYWNARKALLRNSHQTTILIYSIHLPFLKAAVDFKKRNKGSKIVLVVPDLPEFMAQQKNTKRKVLEYFNSKFLARQYRHVDGYVLLSEHMVERLPIGDRPWTVVEGIFNPKDAPLGSVKEETLGRYILYTGTLARRYGIMNLVEAFKKLPIRDVNLVICGDGDSKGAIIEAAKADNRIIYKGLIKREEALRLQQNATLLVNPRTPEGEFTKYSFPSKTMEYLASGIPTLIYKLSGIPDEYYNYCFSIDDLSIEALTRKLVYILELPQEALNEIGLKARHFIYENKSPRNQSRKIIELINIL